MVAGVEYEVDCIIYASGFEVGTEYKRRAGFDVSGRDGLKLSEAWAEGMQLQARHPRARLPQRLLRAADPGREPDLQRAAQPDRIRPHHRRTWSGMPWTAATREVEVTQEAQDAWVALLLTGMGRMMGSPDCTPGYYNNEGQSPGPAARLNVGYPAGATAFFKYIDAWRTSGEFEGLAFR